jgi:type VI secretion system secreted protein VgrG
MPMTQARTLAVSGASLPRYGDTSILTPTRLAGTAALGELFEYTLELKTPDSLAFSPSIAANIDLDALIGTEVTCSIELEGKGEFIAGMMGDSGAAGIGSGIREITGLVTNARLIREEGRSIVYGLTLRPWLWLATKNQDSRLFQDMTVIDITESVLGAYPFPVDKRLIETYPKRDIQRQYWESDFDFICRLWQEWGIYFWFEHSDGKHRLVLCDSIGAHKPHGPAYQTIRYEAPTGKRIDEEHIHALTVNSALTTGTVSTVDYDYTWPRADLRTAQQDPRDTAFANQEHYDPGDYAQPQAGATGLSGEHNQPKQEADFLARVRVQSLRCEGLRASGTGNLRGLETAQTFTLTHYPQSEANREYLVISSTLDIENVAEETQSGSGSHNGQRYRCITNFVIQPAREVFRSPRTIKKPRSYGPETAMVVGPADQEIWTDAYGRLKVQFPWDRQGQSDERSSCWMRPVSTWQGNEFGATHLARVGQEVLVDYLNGDPDLPIVTGRLVNAFQLPAWKLPGNQALSGFRSRELNGDRANHLVMDDSEGKIQAQLSSDHALSQLNLGSITRIPGNIGRQDPRGGGFELRTDEHGVVRAANGLLLTTEARANAQAHAKDMGETVQRLTQARDLQENLADLAQQHQAQDEGVDQSDVAKALKVQNDAIRGGAKTDDNAFPEFTEPHLTIASPVGIQSTTAGSTHIASDEHLALTTGGHVGIATGKSLFATVAQSFKVFVHKLGIKLVAASGKVHIEAQQDDIEIRARKVVEFMSTTDWINLTGKRGIRLSGGGTELEISAEGILGYTDGAYQIHSADHQTFGPQAKPVKLPLTDISQAKVAEHFVLMEHGSGLRLPGQRYRITLADGQLIDGTTNALGETALVLSESMQMATLAFLRNDGTDNAIAIHTPMLMKSADAAYEGENVAPSLALEKRVAGKQQIGTRSAQSNDVQPTSAGKDAMYAQCSPNNWGMRYSTERDKASGQLEYPVAREYMRAMRVCLTEQVQWGQTYLGPEGGKAALRLTWPLSADDRPKLSDLIRPIVGAALSGPSAAGFGVPETAWPTLEIRAFVGGNAIAMGMFTASKWELAVNETWLHSIFKDTPSDKEAATAFKRTVTQSVRELAKTLCHEARHCQQSFWINAMVQQQPQNFAGTSNIAKWPAVSAGSDKPTLAAIANAAITPIPDEPSALIGIKRMAIGEYLREIRVWQASRWYPPYAPDETSLAQEISSARTAAVGLLQNAGTGGTPIDVDKMAAEPYAQMQDYAGRPWEDDAFFCETVAGGYWDLFSGQALRTMPADECSPAYVLASKASSLLARIGSGDAGGKNSVEER